MLELVNIEKLTTQNTNAANESKAKKCRMIIQNNIKRRIYI